MLQQGRFSDTGSICGCTLDGKKGYDAIEGSSVSEKLLGGPGKDYLFGQRGADVLYGGDDKDYLELARIGSQLFIFGSATCDQIASSPLFDTFTTRLSAQPLIEILRSSFAGSCILAV